MPQKAYKKKKREKKQDNKVKSSRQVDTTKHGQDSREGSGGELFRPPRGTTDCEKYTLPKGRVSDYNRMLVSRLAKKFAQRPTTCSTLDKATPHRTVPAESRVPMPLENITRKGEGIQHGTHDLFGALQNLCNPRKWIYDSYIVENVSLRFDNNITSVLIEMYDDECTLNNSPAHREPIPNKFLNSIMRHGMFSNVSVQRGMAARVNIWSKLNEIETQNSEKESLSLLNQSLHRITLFWRKTVWSVKPCLRSFFHPLFEPEIMSTKGAIAPSSQPITQFNYINILFNIGSVQRRILLEAKTIPKRLCSVLQRLTTQQWKPRPAFQIMTFSKFVKDINVRIGNRCDISIKLHDRKVITITSVPFGLLRNFLKMCSNIHMAHYTASETRDHNTTKPLLAINNTTKAQRLFELSTASETTDRAKVCSTTEQLSAINNKTTAQGLFKLSEIVEVFSRGKFSTQRQAFSNIVPLSKCFFANIKINRWTPQIFLNECSPRYNQTPSKEIKPWTSHINCFLSWFSFSNSLNMYIPYAIGQATSHSGENIPAREDHRVVVDEEVCSDYISECLATDGWTKQTTSQRMDNRSDCDEFKDEFNAGVYDFFENVNSEHGTIVGENGFSNCTDRERGEDTYYNPCGYDFRSDCDEFKDEFNAGVYDFFENVNSENGTIVGENGFSNCTDRERGEDTYYNPCGYDFFSEPITFDTKVDEPFNQENGDTKHTVATDHEIIEYEMHTTSEDWLIGDGGDYGMFEELTTVDNFRNDEDHSIEQVAREYQMFSETVPDNLAHIYIPMKELSDIVFAESSDGEAIPYASGGFGDIFQARLTETLKSVIVKKIKNMKFVDVIREMKIQQYLMPGQYVPEVYGLIGGPGFPETMILQEFCADGKTLYYIIQECHAEELLLEKEDWLQLCCNLANSLKDMHQKGVLHNDIKSDNILIEFNQTDILDYFIDFGQASFRTGRRLEPPPGCTDCSSYADYLAPEVRQCMLSSPQSDIYSLGKLFFEIAYYFCDDLGPISVKMCENSPEDRISLTEVIDRLEKILVP